MTPHMDTASPRLRAALRRCDHGDGTPPPPSAGCPTRATVAGGRSRHPRPAAAGRQLLGGPEPITGPRARRRPPPRIPGPAYTWRPGRRQHPRRRARPRPTGRMPSARPHHPGRLPTCPKRDV